MNIDKLGYHAEINKYVLEKGYTLGTLDFCIDFTDPEEFTRYFEFLKQVKRLLDQTRRVDKKYSDKKI